MSSDESQALARSLGATIRAIRKEAGLTLATLAQRSGLSQPFLSQTENGNAMPSVVNLHRIAQALGTTAHALLERGTRSSTSLVRAGEGRTVEYTSDATVRFLVDGHRIMEPNEVTAGPHSHTDGTTSHAGEEFVYVVAGTVRMTLEGEPDHVLHAGDTLYYPATVPHAWFNDTDQPARFLITSSPPGF
ncbi:transcriptional regulator [Rhodococcus rhodnii LMG 5362]|uniref:Transcriptional regulator n=1 Tax=Rhodococcus rhodnii LMG 5362 TaxID=1273125 RepID=R7WTT6_9NOCA|nr:XRE family transcriptional regulator [Rhodococcus rhodnii]EOM77564.1 transcriptional regulator [Rhodococcus rhodnii LMG 5362]